MSPHARETRPFASEVKFIVDQRVGAQIRSWARTHMTADPHGTGAFGDEYHTTSLYFDTEAGDVFHRRGSYGRSKYRIRRYGDASVVFLERKLRMPGVLVKRRTFVGIDTIERLAAEHPKGDWSGDWFHRRLLLRRITPSCVVSYERMARSASTAAEPARLTLDHAVRVARAGDGDADRWGALGRTGAERNAWLPVLDGQMILELKYRQDLPPIFKRLVETFALAPQRASKYRLGIAALADVGFPLARPTDTMRDAASHV